MCFNRAGFKTSRKKSNSKNRKYDAILIDEAQDFKKEWFGILLYFFRMKIVKFY